MIGKEKVYQHRTHIHDYDTILNIAGDLEIYKKYDFMLKDVAKFV